MSLKKYLSLSQEEKDKLRRERVSKFRSKRYKIMNTKKKEALKDTHKECAICKILKPKATCFEPDKRTSDGYKSCCTECKPIHLKRKRIATAKTVLQPLTKRPSVASMAQEKPLDIPKILELYILNRWSVADIARFHGTTEAKVRTRINRFLPLLTGETTAEEVEGYGRFKSEILGAAELSLLMDLMDPGKRNKASLNNTAYALDKVHNMARLNEGKSTENINVMEVTADLETIQRKKEELKEKLKILKAEEDNDEGNE